MRPLQNRFNSFAQGRVSSSREARQQLVLRNNLEKRLFRQLSALFKKFVNTNLYLYREFGIYETSIAQQRLNEEFIPVMLAQYKKIFKAMYGYNENKYYDKKEDAFVFGRSLDFESVVQNYFNTRQLNLVGITARLATRISNLIEQGRADNLNLAQITKLVSDKFLPISRSRAALIARTETHNAASFANHAYHLTVQQDLGTKMLKKWIATNDDRTRSTHASANGQTVDMDEKFLVGGTEMGYAGDSNGGAKNVINCRCVIIYADEQDVVLD